MSAIANNNLKIILTAVDKASGVLKDVSSQIKKTNDSVSQATSKAKTFTKTAGALASVTGGLAVREFASFEKQMSKVGGITNATEDDMARLTKVAKEMGATTAFTGQEAGQALEYLGMAGLSVDESISALPGALQLASAGQLELGQAADIATNVMAQFGIEAENIGRVNDVLAKSATSANTNVSELAEAMKYIGPVANSMGMELEETASAIDVLANNGIKGGMAGQALSSSLLRLTKLTPNAETSLEKLGGLSYDMESAMQVLTDANYDYDDSLESVQDSMEQYYKKHKMTEKEIRAFNAEMGITKNALFDAEGGFIGITETVRFLEEATKDMTEQQRNQHIATIFGTEASKHWLTLLKEGSGELENYTNELNNAEGSAKKMADTNLDNLAGSFTLLKSAISGLMIDVGEKLANYLKPAIEGLTNLLTNFREIWGGLDDNMKKVITSLGLVAVGFTGLIVAVGAFGIVAPVVTGAIGTITAALGLLLSPIGLIVAGIVALGVAYKTNFLGFADVVSSVIEMVTPLFETLKGIILDTVTYITDYIGRIKEPFMQVMEFIRPLVEFTFKVIVDTIKFTIENILLIVNGGLTALKGVFQVVFAVISGIVEVFLNLITGDFSGAWEAIKSATALAWEGIKNIFTGVFEALKGAVGVFVTFYLGKFLKLGSVLKGTVGKFLGVIKNLFNKFFGNAKGIASKGLNVIKNIFSTVFNAIKGIVTGAFNTIKQVFSGGMNTVKGVVSSGMNAVKGVFSNITGGIKNVSSGFLNHLKSTWSSVIGSVKGGVSSGFNNIKSSITSVINSLTGKFSAFKQKISNIYNTVKGWLPFFDGAESKAKNTQSTVSRSVNAGQAHRVSGARAIGGPVMKGKSYLVGENGPEIFKPNTNGQIDPNVGNGGAININFGTVNINNGQDERTFYENVKKTVIEVQRKSSLGY